MITEVHTEANRSESNERRAYRLVLDFDCAEFFRWYFRCQIAICEAAVEIASSDENRKKLQDDVNLYDRLVKSFKTPIPKNDSDLSKEYGVNHDDYRGFVDQVEEFGTRLPFLLRNLVILDDAFVEAGAKPSEERDCWFELATHLSVDFNTWRRQEMYTEADKIRDEIRNRKKSE